MCLRMPYVQFAMSLLMFFRSIYTRHCDDPWFLDILVWKFRQNHSVPIFPIHFRGFLVHMFETNSDHSQVPSTDNTWWVLNLHSYPIPPWRKVYYTSMDAWFLWYTCREMYHMKTWILYGNRLNHLSDPHGRREGFDRHFCSTLQRSECNRISPQFWSTSSIDFFSLLRMETNKRGGKTPKKLPSTDGTPKGSRWWNITIFSTLKR